MFAGKNVKSLLTGGVYEFYPFLIISYALIHILYLIAYLVEKVDILLIYNAASVFFYLIIYILYTKKRIVIVNYIVYLEILAYIYLQAYFVGSDIGMLLFPVCLVQSIMFIENSSKLKIKLSTFFSILALLEYFAIAHMKLGLITDRGIVSDNIALAITSVNIVIAIGAITIVTKAFLQNIETSNISLQAKNVELSELVNIDPLTHLYNRRCIKQKLEQAINNREQTGEEFSIAIIDIDDFKTVNDTYGHDCGDYVLQRISKIMMDNVRDNDFVCRWGGEEILILFNNANSEISNRIATRIHDCVYNEKIEYKGAIVTITITVGVTDSKKHKVIQEMITEADSMLYAGKKQGKNCIVTIGD